MEKSWSVRMHHRHDKLISVVQPLQVERTSLKDKRYAAKLILNELDQLSSSTSSSTRKDEAEQVVEDVPDVLVEELFSQSISSHSPTKFSSN